MKTAPILHPLGLNPNAVLSLPFRPYTEIDMQCLEIIQEFMKENEELMYILQHCGPHFLISLFESYRLATKEEVYSKVTLSNSVQVNGHWFIRITVPNTTKRLEAL